MRMIIDAIIISTVLNDIMLIRTIESLWHDYICVICSSFAASVLVLAQTRPVFHVYVHIASYTHFGSIVGASHVLDYYRNLGLICVAHCVSLHVIVVLERISLLHLVLFMAEHLCMNSCVVMCQ